ncbi:hypothetical protein BgAZ_400910 [Babesia gibsoni]|uniref:Uncharacterized protein n=1 Tax=Babesia gibsoni TaxID=33632 RepID=A0AAD8LNL9_BABGI|nr:hypothetical protein BgAZ_400910 [Babesia gibsoni]
MSHSVLEGDAKGPEPTTASSAQESHAPDLTLPQTPYFNVEGLTEEEKNLLIFMSFSSYLDWQERFLESYKEILVNRSTRNGSDNDSVNYGYYNVLNELLQQQKSLLKTSEEDDSSINGSDVDANELSFFRQTLRLYHVEMYIKVMLLVFLMKLPTMCYFVITLFYIAYLLLAAGIVIIPLSKITQWRLIRYIATFVRWIYRIVSPIASRARPFIFPPRARNTSPGQQALPQPPHNQTHIAENTDTANENGRGDNYRGRENVDNREMAYISEMDNVTDMPQRSEMDNATEMRNLSEMYNISEANNRNDAVHASQRENRTEIARISDRGAVPTNRNRRHAVPYYKKAIYQLFVAYLLSVIPWWEPDPVYVDERD